MLYKNNRGFVTDFVNFLTEEKTETLSAAASRIFILMNCSPHFYWCREGDSVKLSPYNNSKKFGN